MLRSDVNERPFWLAVVSTGRAANALPYDQLIGDATWYVAPDDVPHYLANGAAGVRPTGSLVAARNQALADAYAHGVPCLQLSDDMRAIVYAEPKEDCTAEVHRYRRVRGTLAELVGDLVETARQTDARLVGVAPTNSLTFYNHLRPVSLAGFVLGDCMWIEPTHLRFDPNLLLKEDYDYTAQHLTYYGVAARVNRWLLEFAHRSNVGGAVARRTSALEQQSITYLQDKWGENIMRRNPRKPNEITLRWPRSLVRVG